MSTLMNKPENALERDVTLASTIAKLAHISTTNEAPYIDLMVTFAPSASVVPKPLLEAEQPPLRTPIIRVALN
jgi:hypothetical protein